MTSRLSSVTFPDPVAQSVYPVKLYSPSKCRTPRQPQPSRWNLEIQLAVALRQVKKLTAENEQLRSDNTQQLEQLQQNDAALQQHDLEAARLRQQHEKQQMQLDVLEQLLEARPKQQQQPEHIACSKDTAAPAAAAAAASRPAECTAPPGTLRAQTSAAIGMNDGKGCVLLEAADSVEQPQAPSIIDSKASYSPRSSDSSCSDDEGSSNGNIAAKEQTAPATCSWWWWSPPNTSNFANTTPISHTTGGSESESESSIFSSWWMTEPAEDMAVGAAGDILYI